MTGESVLKNSSINCYKEPTIFLNDAANLASKPRSQTTRQIYCHDLSPPFCSMKRGRLETQFPGGLFFSNGFDVAIDQIAGAWLNLWRLCAMAMSPSSVFTFSRPRRKNLLNPLFCLMFPNTASTFHLCFRFWIPSSLISSSFVFLRCRLRLGLR